MACSSNATCDACHSWASGTIKPRELKSANCDTEYSSTITNCKYYTGLENSTDIYANTCVECMSNSWLNVEYRDKSVGLVSNATYPGTAKCAVSPLEASTCSEMIANCQQNACIKITEDSAHHRQCMMCKKGYRGENGPMVRAGYQKCTNTGLIANCDYHRQEGSSTLESCFICKEYYAVSSDGKTCKAFSAIKDCRKLNSSGTCHWCNIGYYWAGAVCKLKTNLSGLNIIAISLVYL